MITLENLVNDKGIGKCGINDPLGKICEQWQLLEKLQIMAAIGENANNASFMSSMLKC